MYQDPREILFEEFKVRRQRNPRYSLRAFSSSVGLSPGCVSEIFSKKRRLTPYLINCFIERMHLPEDRKVEFLRRVEAHNEGMTEQAKLEEVVRIMGVPRERLLEEITTRLAKVAGE